MGIFDGFFDATKNTDKAFGVARDDFNRTRQTTDPFFRDQVQVGSGAISRLGNFVNDQGAFFNYFQNSPGFQFVLDEGFRNINQSAAARGLGQSGTNLKSLTDFAQGLQNQEINNYISQLGGIANLGAQGANGLTNNSQNFGNLAISQGQARDAGNQAAAGNIASLLSTGLGFAAGFPRNGRANV